uniref:Uncharacterized protein n=1 Tax=Glossina palpalis gambiensis TaxID=67801 RepID=A0A1B0BLZ1_9MUSC
MFIKTITILLAVARVELKSLFDYNINNPEYDETQSNAKNDFKFDTLNGHSNKQLSKRSPPPHAKAYGRRAHNGYGPGHGRGPPHETIYYYEPHYYEVHYHVQDPPPYSPFPMTKGDRLMTTYGTPKSPLPSCQLPEIVEFSTAKPTTPAGVFWEPANKGTKNDELIHDIDVRLGDGL